MKYKAGDVVVIVKQFHEGMSREMYRDYAEKEMTIDSISDRPGHFPVREEYFYYMKEDTHKWGWTDSMISRLATRYPRSSESKLKKSLPLI